MTKESGIIIIGEESAITTIFQAFTVGEEDTITTIFEASTAWNSINKEDESTCLTDEEEDEFPCLAGDSYINFNKHKYQITYASELYDFTEEKEQYNKHDTILIYLSENKDHSAQITQLKQINDIRNKLPFNIIPICKNKASCSNSIQDLVEKYPDLCREVIEFDLDSSDYKTLFSKIAEVALATATPVYQELINATNNLILLDKILDIHVKEIDTLLEYLNNAKKCSGKEALKKYFQAHHSKIKAELLLIQQYIARQKLTYEDEAKHIFYNIICSITNILAFCSIIGTYHAYQQFSQNNKNHGSIFKFFATNYGDEIQENCVSIENAVDKASGPK